VPSAAGSPSQKRQRERRTYQLDQPGQRVPGSGRVEKVKRGAHLAGHPVHLRQRPPIQRGRLAGPVSIQRKVTPQGKVRYRARIKANGRESLLGCSTASLMRWHGSKINGIG